MLPFLAWWSGEVLLRRREKLLTAREFFPTAREFLKMARELFSTAREKLLARREVLFPAAKPPGTVAAGGEVGEEGAACYGAA